jgi:hypothetical protein
MDERPGVGGGEEQPAKNQNYKPNTSLYNNRNSIWVVLL